MLEAHDAAAAHPDAALPRLRAVRSELAAFLAGSEDVFLDAGRRIAELERMARALLEAARSAGAFKTASGSEDPAEVLGAELRRMSDHLRGSREIVADGAQRLAGLVTQIEILLRTQSHFESIPPTLRMLGLNTRIENARASTQYAGMETVALEVRRLGDGVEPKFRAVFQQAASLLATVQDALRMADGFLHGKEVSWGEMVSQTQASLAALQEMAQAGTGITDRAVAGSERLAQQVGALLVALQGHDATRQALEHVAEELEELEADRAAGARLAEVARVTSAQVRGARERFVGSLDELSRSLRAIDGIGAELSRETDAFVRSGSGAAAAAAVRRGVDGATHCLLQHVAQEALTGEAMSRVVVTVEEMGRSVKDIQGIGTAVKIIALNALVETERAGESGRVLAVLAQGIGSLAGEVVQRTGGVARTLNGISTEASALRTAVARGGAANGEGICGRLEKLSLRLSEIQRGLEAAVAGMHQESRTLGAGVEALAGRVAQARAGADRLAAAEAVLAALGAEAAPAQPCEPGESGGPEAEPSRAYARYTMESERAIHDRVIHGVERPEEPATPAAGGGADGLGANVELF